MTVDWTKPIEAVHEDGRVLSTYVKEGPDRDGDYWIYDVSGRYPTSKLMCVRASGDADSSGWRIRNVQPAAAKPAEIDAALVERMVALVRHAAVSASGHTQEEARAIVAELPEPVDPDLLEARKCAISVAEADGDRDADSWYATATAEDNRSIALALAAIKRGRALEREAK